MFKYYAIQYYDNAGDREEAIKDVKSWALRLANELKSENSPNWLLIGQLRGANICTGRNPISALTSIIDSSVGHKVNYLVLSEDGRINDIRARVVLALERIDDSPMIVV